MFLFTNLALWPGWCTYIHPIIVCVYIRMYRSIRCTVYFVNLIWCYYFWCALNCQKYLYLCVKGWEGNVFVLVCFHMYAIIQTKTHAHTHKRWCTLLMCFLIHHVALSFSLFSLMCVCVCLSFLDILCVPLLLMQWNNFIRHKSISRNERSIFVGFVSSKSVGFGIGKHILSMCMCCYMLFEVRQCCFLWFNNTDFVLNESFECFHSHFRLRNCRRTGKKMHFAFETKTRCGPHHTIYYMWVLVFHNLVSWHNSQHFVTGKSAFCLKRFHFHFFFYLVGNIVQECALSALFACTHS